jgi:hypothetical protein
MSERQNTLVCIFDHESPRISAFHIHEWLHEQLRLPENDVRLIQIEGPRRGVYIKFTDTHKMQTIYQNTRGIAYFKHDIGYISPVKIEIAGMGPDVSASRICRPRPLTVLLQPHWKNMATLRTSVRGQYEHLSTTHDYTVWSNLPYIQITCAQSPWKS